MKVETRNSKLETFCVFLFLLALYLAFSGDRFSDLPASDEWVMFRTTVAMVDEGSFRPKLDERYAGQEAKYGLGQSLAAVPLSLITRSLVGPIPVPPPLGADTSDFETAFSRWKAVAFPLACATNALICAAVGAMFLALARRLGYGRRVAIAGALIVGTTTILAPYSKSFFSEPLVALSLLGAVGAFAGPPGELAPPRAWLRAGVWLAVAILARVDNFIIVPVFLAGLWLSADLKRRQETSRSTGLFVLPLFIITLFILCANYLRSGRFQITGYGGETFSTLFPTGLFGLLLSPSHGAIWFSPPIVVALACIARFHRRNPQLCFVVFATVAIKIFVFAKWWNWFGGWNWGSRFLLPVVPLVMLALLDPLSRWGRLRRMEKGLIGAACAAGLLVQICGLLVAPSAFHGNIQFLAGAGGGQVQPLADREQLLVFSPPQSPLIGNWPILAHGRLDWFGERFTQYFPGWLLAAIFAVLGIAVVLSIAGLARLWNSEQLATGGGESTVEKQALPPVVLHVGWILLAFNIIWFASLAIAMRGNGLWRVDRSEFSDGRTDERSARESAAYLDDEIAVPAGLRAETTEWQGYLELPTSGEYIFYTVALGAFDLRLADRLVLANRLTGGQRSQRVEVQLRRGVYPLRLRYEAPLPQPQSASSSPFATLRAARQMRLYWTIPGGGEYEQVIGRAWLYPSRPGLLRHLVAYLYRLKMGFPIVSLLILWWVWLNATLSRRRTEPDAAVSHM
jgi:hypothetical protein